jgi:hypothetical protein
MADYDINLESLNSKKTNLDEMKNDIDTINKKYSSSTVKNAKTGYEKVSAKITNCMTRLTRGYTNSDNWFSSYLSELEALEADLASFTNEGLGAPLEFTATFEDIFGKITMPAIKTGGDPNCNSKLVPQGLVGDTIPDQIFNYLKEKGFNNAAICGILSNIQYESNFNLDSLGDGGTSYGICQWHNGRWTNLKNYCNENGYDWHSLEGQLEFLLYELETSSKGVYNVLKSVPNTAQGAYNAGYEWCYNFERPKAKETSSPRRGGTASSKYWDIYGNL